jgi:hypothetical protein
LSSDRLSSIRKPVRYSPGALPPTNAASTPVKATASAVQAADHSAAVRSDGAGWPRPTALRSNSSSAATATASRAHARTDIGKTSSD